MAGGGRKTRKTLCCSTHSNGRLSPGPVRSLSRLAGEPTHTLAHVTAGGQQRPPHIEIVLFFLLCILTQKDVPRTRLCRRQQLAQLQAPLLQSGPVFFVLCTQFALAQASKVGRLDAITPRRFNRRGPSGAQSRGYSPTVPAATRTYLWQTEQSETGARL